MTNHHPHTRTPPAERKARARLTPLACLRAGAHRHTQQPPPRRHEQASSAPVPTAGSRTRQ